MKESGSKLLQARKRGPVKSIAQLSKAQVTYEVRYIRHQLKSWRFTPQKPAIRTGEQKPEQVHKWLKQNYAAVSSEAMLL